MGEYAKRKSDGLEVKIGTCASMYYLRYEQRNEVNYDFVEVMACKGGCIGGGGQPKTTKVINDKIRTSRIDSLYEKDVELNIKCSYQNPDIIAVYDEFYKKPLSHLAHELLHTSYSSKKHMLGLDKVEVSSDEIV
jgi:ferredoxin hydrogenase